MSQTPPYYGETPPTGPYYQAPPTYMPPAPTSGFAIASLILGILGIPSCCVPLASVLALILGIFALPAIGRNEAKGRGLAIAGIVLAIVGLLLCIGFWILAYFSPKTVILNKAYMSPAQISDLRSLGVLRDGEDIDVVALTKSTSVHEGGLALTTQRLLEYRATGVVQECRLQDVQDVNYNSTLAYTKIELKLRSGKQMEFEIHAMSPLTEPFRQALEKRVKLAKTAGADTRPAKEESDEEGNTK